MTDKESAFKKERDKFYALVANGNAAAHDWLCLWHDYCHEIDDIVDESDFEPQRMLAVWASANALYSHPFYALHYKVISPSVLVATSIYSDSNVWEKDPQLWKRWWADVMRHCGNEVIFIVAQLCGGYRHVRELTAPMMAMSYVYHADKYGTPQESNAA